MQRDGEFVCTAIIMVSVIRSYWFGGLVQFPCPDSRLTDIFLDGGMDVWKSNTSYHDYRVSVDSAADKRNSSSML
jgi:hypothetical protein